MRFGEIVRRVMNQVGDTSGALITASMIRDWANDGQVVIVNRTHCLTDWYEFESEAEVDHYDLPNNFLSLVGITTDGYPIEMTTFEDANSRYPHRDANDSASSGTPALSWVFANQLWLFPKPSEAQTIRLYYARRPVELSGDNAVPEIPEQYHPDLVTYCVAQGRSLNEDYDEASKLESQFDIRMADVTSAAHGEDDDSYRAVRLLPGDMY